MTHVAGLGQSTSSARWRAGSQQEGALQSLLVRESRRLHNITLRNDMRGSAPERLNEYLFPIGVHPAPAGRCRINSRGVQGIALLLQKPASARSPHRWPQARHPFEAQCRRSILATSARRLPGAATVCRLGGYQRHCKVRMIPASDRGRLGRECAHARRWPPRALPAGTTAQVSGSAAARPRSSATSTVAPPGR